MVHLKKLYRWFRCVRFTILVKRSGERSRGCGAVGRAVAFDVRDPWFKSSHWQCHLLPLTVKYLKLC